MKIRVLFLLIIVATFSVFGNVDEHDDVHKPLKYQKIAISIDNYASFEEALKDEQNINWNVDIEKANAITTSYAAFELKSHLKLLNKESTIVDYNKNDISHTIVMLLKKPMESNHPNIAMAANYNVLGDQGFAIIPNKKTLFITANTRIGLLYGAYELLKKMGFEWYNPNEIHVPNRINQKAYSQEIHKNPYINLRGFWTFSEEYLSEKRVLWLVRNRFNIAGKIEPYLAKKLGIRIWGGEHNLIQQEFSKEGLFEAHPEWFTLFENDRFRVKPTGNYINPSYANPEAAEYFAKQLLERLIRGDLSHVDVLNVWPADRRIGRLDQSKFAKATGNFTDTMLFFYGVIAEHLKNAYEEGILKRKVVLAGISYHLTLEPPTNIEVVKKLEKLRYLHLFYPSTRDWSHPIDKNLDQTDINKKLVNSYKGWRNRTDFNSGVVAYNNKSNYSAIALTDHTNFAENFDFYFPKKGGLYSYMHAIKDNPGPLQLTNILISDLGWKSSQENSDLIAKQTIDMYFENRYGKYAAVWKKIYDEMSLSVSNSKNIFEAESLSSVLFQNVYWAVPPFSKEEAISFIPKYRKGGPQNIPNGFYSKKGSTYKANFLGLDRSIKLQSGLKAEWDAIIEKVKNSKIKQRMQNDIVWFEATWHRYILMALCCDYLIAKHEKTDSDMLKNHILKEIDFLENTKVTDDVVSPVNQRTFLRIIKKLVDLEEK